MNNVQLSNILHIQEASKQDKLVIFVGAGVSTNSGVPMWGKLIESLNITPRNRRSQSCSIV